MGRIKLCIIMIIIVLSFASVIFACSLETSVSNDMQGKESSMKLLIGDTQVEVDWEENESVKQILGIASSSDIIVNAHSYGGFEQVGELGHTIVSSNVQMKTEPGDIVLYNSNSIVVFFGSNSWSYTKLGKIKNKNLDELKQLLDKNNVVLTIRK